MVFYIVPPEDNIQDFVLSVAPPTGPFVLPALELFPLEGILPDWAEGARISGSAHEEIASIRSLVKGGEAVGGDMFLLEAAVHKGDKLIADVRYGGGCARHDFRLTWDGSLDKSDPPQALLKLSHDGNGDPCKALISERLTFDLSPHFEANADVVLRLEAGGAERIVPRI